MAEATFGERLAEARRIKGETIEEVSAKLRIRPSIILAMETSNFSHMPHMGYARNMVSSYARYLGLKTDEVTKQFLHEFRNWEKTSKRSGGGNASTLSLASRRYVDSNTPVKETEPEGRRGGRKTITAAKRNEDRPSVWGSGDTRDTDKKFREQLRQMQDDKDTRQSLATRRAPTRRTEPAKPPARQVRTNDYVGKPPKTSLFAGIFSNLSSRPVLMIAGLVLAFLAILILWAVLASNCSSNEANEAPLPSVGASDEGLDEDQASNNLEEIQAQIEEDNSYGAFDLMVEVVEGESWLQIDIDGSTPIGEVVAAPWKQTFTVNTEMSLQAGAPANVRAFRNGIEVPIETENGLGVLELKVVVRPIAQNAQDADTASQG